MSKYESASSRYSVCQFSAKMYNFDFFDLNLPKNGFMFWNSENYCRNKNQHPQDTMCANFQAKRTTSSFLAQICPKMDSGLEIQKTNVGIRISILEIPCVPIFRQNGQLELQKSKSGFRISTSKIPCYQDTIYQETAAPRYQNTIFSQNGQLWVFKPKISRLRAIFWF